MTTLYKLYASDDSLLYVGITDNLKARLSAHGFKIWWADTVRIETTDFEIRWQAQIAEAEVIRDESPRYNVVRNRVRLECPPTDHDLRRAFGKGLERKLRNHPRNPCQWIGDADYKWSQARLMEYYRGSRLPDAETFERMSQACGWSAEERQELLALTVTPADKNGDAALN